MAKAVRTVDYFKMMTPNRPGEGDRVLRVLRKARVNLLAFSGFPRSGRAQMDFIPQNSAAFLKAMKKAGLPVGKKKTAFLIQGKDRVGAVAQIARRLGRARINITAIDALTAGKGRYGAVLWVKPAHVRKAAKILGA